MTLLTTRPMCSVISFVFMLGLCQFFLFSCHRWQRDVTVNGIHFTKLREDTSDMIIGFTSEDVEIGQFKCKKGWIHFDTDMNLKSCALRESIEYKGNLIPADTWIQLGRDQTIVVCAFPDDTMIQNRLCKGTGGPKGFQTSFYPNGKLKSFFSREDAVIDGVPCKASGTSIITLHNNGKLKGCTLAEDYTKNNQTIKANTRVHFDEQGILK